MNLILFDDPDIRTNLLPFTFTRPVSKIRTGILTIDEKWNKRTQLTPSFLTDSYLQKKYPLTSTTDNLLVNGAICPDDDLVKAVMTLNPGENLVQGDLVIASRQSSSQLQDSKRGKSMGYSNTITIIDRAWQIFAQNGAQL